MTTKQWRVGGDRCGSWRSHSPSPSAGAEFPAAGDKEGGRVGVPRDLSAHQSGAVDRSHRTPLVVHADDGKGVFRADGPVDVRVDHAAMREIGEPIPEPNSSVDYVEVAA